MKNDYAVFIISHKRPEVETLKALEKSGYTGDYFIVIDDADPTIEEYKSRYGKHVLVFSKEEIWQDTDTIDNAKILTSATYARNYCIKAARNKGYEFFVNLDDDINRFAFRYIEGDKLAIKSVKNIGKVFEEYIKYMKSASLTCTAFILAGRLMGGIQSPLVKSCFYSRPTNCLIMRSSTPLFKSTVCEDVIYALDNNEKGLLTYGLMPIVIYAGKPCTGNSGGGMAEYYATQKEYTQFFHIKVIKPTAVSLRMCSSGKVKVRFDEKYFLPKILNEEWKKK